jgi:glucose/arabinose dehydrogenase
MEETRLYSQSGSSIIFPPLGAEARQFAVRLEKPVTIPLRQFGAQRSLWPHAVRLAYALFFFAFAIPAACTTDRAVGGAGMTDATAAGATSVDAAEPPAAYVEAAANASLADPCSLPGSIQFTASGTVTVVGGPAGTDSLSFLHLPAGFCAHYFAFVGNTNGGDVRQMRFAPGGELFVSSPQTPTTGGNGNGGLGAIVVLPDDNGDGTADTQITFLSNLPSTQGLLFANDQLYYQDGTSIMSVPYRTGDRAPSGQATQVADITIYESALHWPKTLDIADDGTIYVGNGGDQDEACDPSRPFHGGILKLDGSPDGSAGGTPVAKGLRNPIAVRCARGHDQCFALELGKDYSNSEGGHEKLVPIHDGDDWGFPCCATRDVPFSDVMPVPDCSAMTADTNAFVIGDTPFGLDFESGRWPAPWTGDVFIVTHGVCCGSWVGARIVAVGMDPNTGLPLASTDVAVDGGFGPDEGAMTNFATGWDDGTVAHGRPAAVTFSSDGRLFVANDVNGIIFWIAPMNLSPLGSDP